ncbi:MAG: 3'-phosphoadenosine 5'-phosphosulfate sulfotransferase, partial [Thermoplasmata archaeon]|nr:3'-phosphoadenosine 5'-phosphosulfate sulfotransferase [Thermoplasmata archaeon]
MPIVRLGKLVLRWCTHCNLPVLESKACEVCSSPTTPVKVTPPGDIRPAFEFDLAMIREIISQQFGGETGELVLPLANKVVLLNKAPDIDRMD